MDFIWCILCLQNSNTKAWIYANKYDKYTIEHVTSEFRETYINKTLYTGTKADIIGYLLL